MKRSHKYFVNQRYTLRAERLYVNVGKFNYKVDIRFVCTEPDINLEQTYYTRQSDSPYVYYQKPNVSYKIIHSYSRFTKYHRWNKRISNRRVRYNKDILYNRAEYKRVFDMELEEW